MKRKYLPIVITIILFLVIYGFGKNVPPEAIKIFVTNAGPIGPALLTALFLLAYTISPLGGSPLLLAGYYMYGVEVVWLSYIAAVLSFMGNFWIARKFGREYVEKLLGHRKREHLDRFMKHKGARTVVLLRFFVGAFQDVISYAMGLTKIKFRDYFLASLVGSIPGTLIWYLLSKLTTNVEQFVIVSSVLVGVFLGIWIVINHLFRSFFTNK